MSSESNASGRVPAATTTSLPRKGPPTGVASAETRKSRLSAMLSEVGAARTDVQSAVSELESKTTELATTKKRVEELEAELSITQDGLQAKTAELAEVTGYKDQISTDLGALRLEHEKVKEELGAARGLLGEDDEAFQKVMTELRALRAQLAGVKNKLAPKAQAPSADAGAAES